MLFHFERIYFTKLLVVFLPFPVNDALLNKNKNKNVGKKVFKFVQLNLLFFPFKPTKTLLTVGNANFLYERFRDFEI
jgi:hypothetical protein